MYTPNEYRMVIIHSNGGVSKGAWRVNYEDATAQAQMMVDDYPSVTRTARVRIETRRSTFARFIPNALDDDE